VEGCRLSLRDIAGPKYDLIERRSNTFIHEIPIPSSHQKEPGPF
jgi:hypothetical protein